MIPKPTIQQAVEALRDRDEYRTIVQFVRDERERLFGDLGPAETPNEVMKIAGGVARLDELLLILDA
jgi:histidinol-phosphate/aromatic aminotransferase/cobyric acid decarboxylase-like protein